MPMQMPEKLWGAALKVERAKQHINNLEATIRVFNATDPYKIGAKRDPQTRRPIYYVSEIKPVPLEVSLLAGEAVHLLRCALDHLAYQIWLAGSQEGKETSVAFPIFDDAAKYKAGRAGKIKGAPQALLDALDAIEPYHGGKGHQLWVLNKLDNIDKHRLLITAAGRFSGFDIGGHISRLLQQAHIDWGLPEPPIANAWFRPADRLCPLKAGDVLFTGAPDEDYQEPQFAFEIAFAEPGILEGEVILSAIDNLGKLVYEIIAAFRNSL